MRTRCSTAVCTFPESFLSLSHIVFNVFFFTSLCLLFAKQLNNSRTGSIHFGCMKNAWKCVNKKARHTNKSRKFMDNFQSSSFGSCVCVLHFSALWLLRSMNERMNECVCVFLLSCIIDFWYLAFASLHLSSTNPHTMNTKQQYKPWLAFFIKPKTNFQMHCY